MANNLWLSTNSVERIRITDVGDVGIGTTAPDRLAAAADCRVVTIETATGAKQAILELVGKDVGTGVSIAILHFVHNDAGTFRDLAKIVGETDTSASTGRLALFTGTSRRVVITSGGVVEFQGNVGAVRSKFDVECSLLTSESNRVAPWIEPEVICSTNTTIDTTTATDITGATVTFTPKSNCRVQVTAHFDVTVTTLVANDIFNGRLLVNGTAEAAVAPLGGVSNTMGTRQTVGQVWNFLLTGGTSYTIKLSAQLVTDNGSVYTVGATHTKFSLIGAGRF